MPRPNSSQRPILICAGVLLALQLGGCGIQPWVKPYERESLADPIMNLQRSTLIGQHREHVYDVREASRGATGIQGTGCGCN